MNFASDNASPAHPNVIEAISRANHDFVGSYGSDPIMQRVRQQIRDIFEAPDAAVYLVATGSAANALALATYCPPWGAVYCHDVSHIEMDECGAPEFYTGGAKLAKISGAHAKIDPDALEHALASAAAVGVHNVQRGMLSLSNVTELGACYSADELSALCGLAKQYDLPVHLDGARFANALVATGATPAELSWRAGVDVLSFGGTKNGLMGVEAVVMFDPAKAWEFELRRKRGGHLFSKHRYLSAQMEAYLTDGLWLEMAGQANAMGSALAEGLGASNVAHLLHPADANMIFVSLPAGRHRAAQEAGAVFYPLPPHRGFDGPEDAMIPARLVASWCTSQADVSGYLNAIAAA